MIKKYNDYSYTKISRARHFHFGNQPITKRGSVKAHETTVSIYIYIVDSLNFSATAVLFIDRRASDSEPKLAPPLLSTLSTLRSQWERHSVIQ